MPTLNQVRTRVDNWLSNIWPTINNRQDTYFAGHGRYWQGLWTNTQLPQHTTAADDDLLPDDLNNHPTDQSETWLDIFPELANVPVPAALWIDVYDGPAGHGYTANIMLKYNGTIYHRAQNLGPESWRTVSWHIVDPEDLGL